MSQVVFVIKKPEIGFFKALLHRSQARGRQEDIMTQTLQSFDSQHDDMIVHLFDCCHRVSARLTRDGLFLA